MNYANNLNSFREIRQRNRGIVTGWMPFAEIKRIFVKESS